MVKLSTFKKRWQQFQQRIVLRKQPHAVLSWRYLLPGQSLAVRQHKAAFKQAWPRFPRPVWWMIALYSYTLWYFWHSWRQVVRVWLKVRPKQVEPIAIPPWRQALELCWLALAHAIPPIFYYRYQLYRLPEREWLKFIYTHELPHWHQTQSPKISQREHDLITDKFLFAEQMQQQGIPSIPTIKQLKQGDVLLVEQLFQQQDLFIKPVASSQKQGCYELLYQPQEQTYQLQGIVESRNTTTIIAVLQQELNQQPLLLQPLLCNHPQLAKQLLTRQLVTLRLITVIVNDAVCQQVEVLCATLEIPLQFTDNSVIALPISITDGQTQQARQPLSHLTAEQQQVAHEFSHQQLPGWEQAVKTAQKAHLLFPNIKTIGWDLAITDQGIVLIEGNFNWGVAVHQQGGQPLAELISGVTH